MAETFIQVAPDSTGKKVRNVDSVHATETVLQQVVTLAHADGTLVEDDALPIEAASLPLPTGAASETTLASIDGKTPSLASGRVPVDGSGVTQPVSGTVTANAGTGPFPVGGQAAHGASVAGNPVLEGFEARTTDPTAVTSGQAVRAHADSLGKQVVLLGARHDRVVSGQATYTNTTAANVIAAGGAGVRTVVTSVVVTNAHATVSTKVEIRDGTTVKLVNFAVANGGGFALADPTGLFVSTANTAVTARCVTTGADVDVFVSGYQIAN